MMMSFELPTLSQPVTDRDHIIGPANAAVTLVEYGDFECPYCGMAHPIVKEILSAFGNQLRFAYRHFPLSRVHPHAESAAEAAEAAGAQGSFWPMHDLLFEHQDALEDRDLLTYAAALDLDLERFAAELEAGVHAARVREDFLSGVRSGVNGTPTFFINGERYDGTVDFASLAAAINARSYIRS
jgi:protein-disulfide isomerase